MRKEKWFQERRKAYESLADNNYRKNAPVETFQMGDAVYAWWWNKKKHTSKYKATVEKVNENGTYDIVYNDDGKKEKEVKWLKTVCKIIRLFVAEIGNIQQSSQTIP